jgi:hypothetical protein
LELCTQQKEWPQVVTVLARLAAVSQSHYRAKYLVAAAKILTVHCRQLPRAAAMFEAALDASPNDEKLALRVERFYLENSDAVGYERHLRRQLIRISKQHSSLSEEANLWEKLLRLYKGPLQNPTLATVALEVIASLKQCPDSYGELAAAYEQAGTAALPRAVQIYVQQAHQSNDVPDLTEALRALQRIFGRTGDLGRSLNVSTGLVLIGQGNAAERDLVERATNATFVPPEASLRSSSWQKHIYHHGLSRPISAVFAHVSMAVAATHARSAKAWGLPQNWEQRPDTERRKHPLVYRLEHLATSLGIALPPLAFNMEFDGIADLVAISANRSVKLALVLGKAFFEPRTDAFFAFIMGRLVARLRPEFIVTWPNACSSEGELRSVLAAACDLASGEPTVSADNPALFQHHRRHFAEQISPASIECIRTACGSIDRGGEQVSEWLKSVSLTVNRAGLLMCRDLVCAVAAATTDRIFSIGLGQFEATRDLLAWSSTSEYALFARQLGSHE